MLNNFLKKKEKTKLSKLVSSVDTQQNHPKFKEDKKQITFSFTPQITPTLISTISNPQNRALPFAIIPTALFLRPVIFLSSPFKNR